MTNVARTKKVPRNAKANERNRAVNVAKPTAQARRSVARRRGMAMARLPSRKALARRKEAAAYAADVRLLSCVASGFSTCAGDVVAAHMTTNLREKGMGLKAPDANCVPLCTSCHDQWSGRVSPRFTDGWTKEQRFELAKRWVQETTERVKTLRLGREMGEPAYAPTGEFVAPTPERCGPKQADRRGPKKAPRAGRAA